VGAAVSTRAASVPAPPSPCPSPRGEGQGEGGSPHPTSPLVVLSVAYPLAEVGTAASGGAERVLGAVDRALVAAGHRSVVVAADGSRVAGELVPLPRRTGTLHPPAREAAQADVRTAVAAALRRERIDLVHMHGIDFDACLPEPGVPVLATLHLPLDWYPARALRPDRPGTFLHCVSAAQRLAGPPGIELLPDVPNGVDIDAFGGPHARRRFVLMIGRVCPEKGFHLGLDAAAAAGAPALLAGAVHRYPEHVAHFRREILPRLGPSRRFLGPAGPRRLRRLLAAARCVLVPSLCAETASLAAMEALASGTPVVAFPNGALADVVEHGRTGFLVRDAAEMAAAIARVGDIDPAACRAAARARFDLRRTTAAYLALHRRLSATRDRSEP
jgi:glycosyltransferase involved in cell wall biosynthesis